MRSRRVPQPPVDPLARDPERHDFWPGFAVALFALILLVSGTSHLTGLETQEGEPTRETELIKAFARGGLQFLEAQPRFDPTTFQDPAMMAAAIERASRIADLPLGERYRVNKGAADPCPT